MTQRILVVVMCFALGGCGGLSGPVEFRAQGTEPADCTRSPAELLEIRERNQSRPPFTSAELRRSMKEPGHAAHLRLWRDTNSYYALLGIVEGIIQPKLGRIRKEDIRELLGEGQTTFPGAASRWLYYSSRHIPSGAHAVIEFDDRDTVKSVDWVSE